MKITNIQIEAKENHQVVSAQIDKLTLWFRIPGDIEVDPSDATPFAIFALLPSMLFKEDLQIDDKYSVSQLFLNNVEHIQSIYKTWNEIFQPINILARPGHSAPRTPNGGSFFSGGVDGTYTLFKHMDEIDSLIVLNGFDFKISKQNWLQIVKKKTDFLQKYGKRLIPVETNHQSFLAAFGLTGFSNYGGTLSGIGQLLGCDKIFISGADTYELIFPCGSHPLFDHFYSTESTTIVHTGLEADRTAKLKLIKQHPDALANLWVCSSNPVLNCGVCSKCIRTHVALLLNDVNDFYFEQPIALKDINKISFYSEEQLTFFKLFYRDAKKLGKKDLARVLGRKIVRVKFRSLLLEFEESYLESIRAWRKAKRPPGDEFVSINIFPRYSDSTTLARAKKYLRQEDFQQEVHDIGSVYY